MMRGFDFWHRWLLAVAAALMLFGLLVALFSATPLFAPFNRAIDPAFWGRQAVDPNARAFQAWAYGVWGATIAGWGLVLLALVHGPFRRRESRARDAAALGLLVWFVLDTGASLYHGVVFNAALNSVIAALAGLPLLRTRRAFA